jgi:hypothetical protein
MTSRASDLQQEEIYSTKKVGLDLKGGTESISAVQNVENKIGSNWSGSRKKEKWKKDLRELNFLETVRGELRLTSV